MVTLKGLAASAGIAIGQIVFTQKTIDEDEKKASSNDSELASFLGAVEKTSAYYNELYKKAEADSDKQAAELLVSYEMMVTDPAFVSGVKELIENEGMLAIEAVNKMAKTFADMLVNAGEYMSERRNDIYDVFKKVNSYMTKKDTKDLVLNSPSILFSYEMTSSEFISLDKEKVLALITSKGSEVSHFSILARDKRVPYVILNENEFDGYDSILQYLEKSESSVQKMDLENITVIVDGNSGLVIFMPDEKTIKEYEKKMAEYEAKNDYSSMIGLPNETKSGQRMEILCNIAKPDDVERVIEADASGIGVFRTEFMYMDTDDFPGENEQFLSYKKVVELMEGKPVVIRTLDAGSDKQIDYLALDREANPALGMRALRICLKNPKMFMTQLRAILRVSVYGCVSILFPMITDVWEIDKAIEYVEKAKKQLAKEKVAFDKKIKIGAMIETPASALISDELAKRVDFFSIGTNDLVQYTLACDRQNEKIKDFCNDKHPAIIKLIKLVTENAHANGIPVTICGELAKDLEMTEEFIKMGIDDLSVSQAFVLPLRQKIRSIE